MPPSELLLMPASDFVYNWPPSGLFLDKEKDLLLLLLSFIGDCVFFCLFARGWKSNSFTLQIRQAGYCWGLVQLKETLVPELLPGIVATLPVFPKTEEKPWPVYSKISGILQAA